MESNRRNNPNNGNRDLCIRDLTPQTTEQELTDLFKRFGVVDSIRSLETNPTFAFVRYSTKEYVIHLLNHSVLNVTLAIYPIAYRIGYAKEAKSYNNIFFFHTFSREAELAIKSLRSNDLGIKVDFARERRPNKEYV